ncbi:MAG: GGDEF domain-containing phosphodiesterase [Oscillospiraceae bacterium]
MAIPTEILPHYCALEDFFRLANIEMQNEGTPKKAFALVALDFDNFNFINDLFSYEVGDQVLTQITRYFSRQLKDGELYTRMGADHFVFFVAGSSSLIERFVEISNAKNVLARILPAHYTLSYSGGIVLLKDREENFSALLDKANFARKQAKGRDANTFYYYDEKMDQELQWKKSVTFMMESALQHEEFQMYLQPKVLMKTGQPVGAEALARWKSREFGLIYPDRFIPILEQNGLIRQLDFLILRQACAFLENCMGTDLPPLPISVNFSKMHIYTPDFPEKVLRTVKEYHIPTCLIEIEFTENIFLPNSQNLIKISEALKQLGFKVALDDFGSAYSSLNYLKDLPLDVIKIDRGFLNATENNDKGRVIIEKVVDLIQSLRLIALMEGVESQEQADFLQKLNCDLAQGYFFARPMPLPDYMEYLKHSSPITDIDDYFSTHQKNVCAATR